MMDIGKEKLIWMYTKMLEMRLFEERIAGLYRRGHAHNIVRGVPLDKLAAGILGKVTGLYGGGGG